MTVSDLVHDIGQLQVWEAILLLLPVFFVTGFFGRIGTDLADDVAKWMKRRRLARKGVRVPRG